jgi:type IV pilus assembly protein PilN
MGVLAVLALALGVAEWFVHRKAQEANRGIHSLQAGVSRIAAERQGYQEMMRRPENAQLLKETDDLNQIYDAKAFSWTLVMEDLETVLPSGVQVTAIDPTREKDGNITLHVRVHGPRDKSIELVKNLELSKRFLSPRIVGESADTSVGFNQKPEPVSVSNTTELDLLAEYNANSPDESSPATAGNASAPDELGPAKAGNASADSAANVAAPPKPVTTLQYVARTGSDKSKPHPTSHLGGAE